MNSYFSLSSACLHTHQSPCLPPGRQSPAPGCTNPPGRSLPGCCHRTPSPDTAHCCWSALGHSSGSPSLPDRTPSPAALWCSCSSSCRCRAPSLGCSSGAASVCDGRIIRAIAQLLFSHCQLCWESSTVWSQKESERLEISLYTMTAL